MSTPHTPAAPGAAATPQLNLADVLRRMLAVSEKVSDLIFSPGRPPQVELVGELQPVPVPGLEKLLPAHTASIAKLMMAGHPVALLGRDGGIIHMNARFERLVGDGVCVRGGCLGSWQPDADAALAAAVGKAVRFEGTKHGPLTSIVGSR